MGACVMRRRRHPEDDLQKAVKKFLDIALPPDAIFHHSPNGGWRVKREAAKFKEMGVKAGWPDITIIWNGGRSWFIELKIDRNTPSLAQLACHTALRLAGSKVEVCKSLDEVEVQLRDWGIPLAASVLPSGAIERKSA